MSALLALLVSLLILSFSANAGEWEYGEGFDDELIFLHEFVNYEIDPDWRREWDRTLFSASGMRYSYGSVSKHTLFERSDVLINRDLGDGWGFRTHVRRYGATHRSDDEFSAFLGFRKSIAPALSLCLESDLSPDKDTVDGSFGVLVADKGDANYARLLFVWDDLTWDARNGEGGDSDRLPLGLSWLARYERGPWELFLSGKYTLGYDRNYPDVSRSPDLLGHERQMNEADMRLSRLFKNGVRCEAEVSLYHFDDSRGYRDYSLDYSYLNTVSHGALRCLIPRGGNRIRLEAHGVRQFRRSDGSHDFRYDRREIMPAAFVSRAAGKHTVEIGYLSSVFDWEYDGYDGTPDHYRNDYIDKMKIGWTYEFNKRARIQFSLSHVVSISNFGGGNGQYVMVF